MLGLFGLTDFYKIKNKVSKLGAYELNKLGLSWGLKLKFEVDVWS